MKELGLGDHWKTKYANRWWSTIIEGRDIKTGQDRVVQLKGEYYRMRWVRELSTGCKSVYHYHLPDGSIIENVQFQSD